MNGGTKPGDNEWVCDLVPLDSSDSQCDGRRHNAVRKTGVDRLGRRWYENSKPEIGRTSYTFPPDLLFQG